MNGLAYIRSVLGMSATSLAKKLNVTRSAVSLWEHGKAKISSDNLKQLSDMLSISEEYFGEITKDQAQEINLIIQCRIQEEQREFEFAEIDKANEDFKKSLLRISEMAKTCTNQYNELNDYILSLSKCSQICNLFADILTLYGTDLIVQNCLTALIRAKESESDFDSEITKAIRQEMFHKEFTRKENDEMKKLSAELDELF